MILSLLLGGQSGIFAPPQILERTSWGAAPIRGPFKLQIPVRITIHHAGVATNRARSLEEKLRALQAFSQREDKLDTGKSKPAWPDIPYHFYIDWRGTLAECRSPQITGDTNTEYDPTGHLLICLEGNFQVEEPTGAQIRTLNQTVFWLIARWKIPAENIASHRDFSQQTTCPGANLYLETQKIRSRAQLIELCSPKTS